jgi:hypothetical protein
VGHRVASTEKSSQVRIAETVQAAARDVAQSAVEISRPSDSYILLGILAAAQDELTQAYDLLATWHGQVVQGVHHSGEGAGGDPENPGWVGAERALREAAGTSATTADALRRAHSANGVARWFDEIRADET